MSGVLGRALRWGGHHAESTEGDFQSSETSLCDAVMVTFVKIQGTCITQHESNVNYEPQIIVC